MQISQANRDELRIKNKPPQKRIRICILCTERHHTAQKMRTQIGNRFDIAKCCIQKVDKFNSPMYKYHQSFNNAQLSIYSSVYWKRQSESEREKKKTTLPLRYAETI